MMFNKGDAYHLYTMVASGILIISRQLLNVNFSALGFNVTMAPRLKLVQITRDATVIQNVLALMNAKLIIMFVALDRVSLYNFIIF